MTRMLPAAVPGVLAPGARAATMLHVGHTLEQPAPPSHDASRRLAAFGLTAFGGLLIGVGALMPWIRTSLQGMADGLSPTYFGIDLPDGIAALVAAFVVLVGLAVARLSRSEGMRRTAVVAAAFVALAAAGVAVVTAAERFEPTVVRDVLADLDPSGNATAEQRAEVEELIETRLAPGPFVVLAGGALAAAGGLLLLSFARRDDEPAPGDTETVEPRPDR
jgi:hypothetical protein